MKAHSAFGGGQESKPGSGKGDVREDVRWRGELRVVACGKLGRELTVTEALHQILTEFRQGLEEIYGRRLAGLVLFDSQARGDALPDSDIDVMVVLYGDVNPLAEARRISRFRGDLCLRHDVVITCVYVSAEEAQAADSPLLQNIRAEGVTV